MHHLTHHATYAPHGFHAAVPMVEAVVALVLVDQLMAQYAQCNLFPINPALQEPLEHPQEEQSKLPL